MSIWKRKREDAEAVASSLDPAEIVSAVSLTYGEYTEKRQLVKPRSSLRCSWFTVRECFMAAYEMEYNKLDKTLHNSYHQIYAELAFFVDDDILHNFDASLDGAVKCYTERCRTVGLPVQEAWQVREYLASRTARIESRKEIWTSLSRQVPNCPSRDRLCLTETLAYCGALYRAMYDEWASFANFVAYLKSDNSP